MQEVKGKLMVFLPRIGGKSPATLFFKAAWTLIVVVHKHVACTLPHCFTHPDLQAVLEMKLRCGSRLDSRFHSHFSEVSRQGP